MRALRKALGTGLVCLAFGMAMPTIAVAAPDKITVVMYGDMSPRMKTFMAGELKERVAKDINVEVNFRYLPWSEYGGGKTDLMYASGESFAGMTDRAYLAKCVAKKFVLDVTALVKKGTPSLSKFVGQFAFETYQLGGKQYAVPVGYKPNASEFYPVLVRQDILEEVGMKSISTVADLESYVTKAQKLHPDYRGTTTALDFALSYSWQKRNLEFLDVGAKNVPIIVTDNADKSAKVFSYWELPEIKNFLAITRRWQEKGLYDLTLLSNPEQALAAWNTGKAFFMSGVAARPVEELIKVRKMDPNVRFANYFMDRGNRTLIKSRTDSTAFSLSSSVTNPEAYIRFFDWWQSSQEVTDFLTYGVKGVDYNVEGDSIVQINSDELIAPWVLWNTNFLRFPDFVPAEVIKNYRVWDNGATIAKGAGFIFDTSPVKSERAKIEGVIQQYMLPLSLGVYSYEDKYAEALKALKAAGIDKYIAEYQKQFTAFNATKK